MSTALMLAKAIAFAAEKHMQQLDKGGNPYILHPIRMMMRLRTTDEELMCIAVLHDVVEDCEVNYNELREIGMSDRVREGVRTLTKLPGETYEQFIDRVLKSEDAMLVKREDLRDNADLTRLKYKEVSAKDAERMTRYMVAFQRIERRLKEMATERREFGR